MAERGATGSWEEELNLSHVSPFERPMTAGPQDKWVGEDELGNSVYETSVGKRYTVRPATEDERRTTRGKVEDWIGEGAPLPSFEQIIEAAKSLPGAMYDSASDVVRGDGTFGEALSILPASGAAGAASRIGAEADDAVLSAMGATHRVPSYKPVDEFGKKRLVHDDYGNTYNKIEFFNPLEDIISEMEIPNNGLKGSQLLKELQDNPTIRNSQIKSESWLEGIDPQKRYSKEEIQALIEGKGWSTFASPTNKYSAYQRQYDLVDKEVLRSDGGSKYVEYAIQSAPNYDQKGFRANSQHYTDDTVAHIRLSERSGKDGNYILVEELQSDLLQQGFQKPTKNWEEARQSYLKQVNDPARYHIFSKLEKQDLEAYWDLHSKNMRDQITPDEFYNAYDNLIEQLTERSGLTPNTSNRLNVNDVLVEAFEMLPIDGNNVSLPPVAKTEETVKLGLQTAMAHAYNEGLTKVVIPPFEEIVAKRFDKGSAQFNQAMDPKSGFYATYVKGVQKAVRSMQEEFGDKIRVTNRDMEYDPDLKEHSFGDWEPEPPDDTLGPLTEALFRQITPKPKVQTLTKQGLEIDFQGLVQDQYDLSKPRFAEGGVVIDPISKNAVPPGAKPSEVRDDIDIKASEGEYVIPADVVRYLGLDKIEKLIQSAKKGLAELDQKGRIGGADGDELPFSVEELLAVDEPSGPPKMAEGGLVSDPTNNSEIDPQTGLPNWLLALQKRTQAAPQTPAPTTVPTVAQPAASPTKDTYTDRKELTQPLTGLAKPVRDWTVEDFQKYGDYRNSPEAAGFRAGASIVPFGGLISGAAQRITERSVNRELESMLKSGTDLQGNPLSTSQLDTLRDTYTRVRNEPVRRLGGLSGVAMSLAEDAGLTKSRGKSEKAIASHQRRLDNDGIINKAIDFISGRPKAAEGSSSRGDGIVEKRSPTSSDRDKPSTKKSTAPSKSTRPQSRPSKSTSSRTQNGKETYESKISRRGGFASGGLITKRNK